MKLKNLVFIIAFLAVGYNTYANDLLGIDSNNNGVRDDVEEYVNETFREPQVHEAAMSYARIVQTDLTLDTSDRENVKQMTDKRFTTHTCLMYRLGYYNSDLSNAERSKLQKSAREIFNKTMNTTERKKASRRVDLAASGMAFKAIRDKRSACDELYK